MIRGRHVLTLIAAAACALPATAGAAQRNQWLGMRVLNQVHQGGEDEAPSNTLYAYQDGLAKGGDMIELDVHATKDGQIVAIHDDTVDRTTNGRGLVSSYTLARLRRLDAAWNFVPGENAVSNRPAADYPLRGVRSGRKAPPVGFEPDDFRIPTLAEVFSAFPDVPVNVEIKGQSPAEKLRVAGLLARFLKRAGKHDVIVVSFDQAAVNRFHELAPRIDVAPGIDGISGFLLSGVPAPPGTKALQIPITYRLGSALLEVTTAEHVRRAHEAGYAVHVWLDKSEENDETYARLLDMCVDGVMTSVPSRFEAFLERRHAPRAGGQGGTDGCRKPTVAPRGCRVRASKLVTPRGGTVAVRLERYGDLRGPCTTRVALTGWVDRPGVRARPVALGHGSVTVPEGRVAAIAGVRLSAAGRRLVRAKPRLQVRTRVTALRPDTRTLSLLTR